MQQPYRGHSPLMIGLRASVDGSITVCLIRWRFQLVDCQAYTPHLETFGAEDWPRPRFLALLRRALKAPTRTGKWTLDLGPAEAAEVFSGS